MLPAPWPDCFEVPVFVTETFDKANGPLGPVLAWEHHTWVAASSDIVVVSNEAVPAYLGVPGSGNGASVVSQNLQGDVTMEVTITQYSGTVADDNYQHLVTLNLTQGPLADAMAGSIPPRWEFGFNDPGFSGGTITWFLDTQFGGVTTSHARAVPGDVLKLELVAGTFNAYLNGSLLLTDSTDYPADPFVAGLGVLNAAVGSLAVDNFHLVGTTWCPPGPPE